MADTLAGWTASMGARLLSSTGEASDHGESLSSQASDNDSSHDEQHDVSALTICSVGCARPQRLPTRYPSHWNDGERTHASRGGDRGEKKLCFFVKIVCRSTSYTVAVAKTEQERFSFLDTTSTNAPPQACWPSSLAALQRPRPSKQMVALIPRSKSTGPLVVGNHGRLGYPLHIVVLCALS